MATRTSPGLVRSLFWTAFRAGARRWWLSRRQRRRTGRVARQKRLLLPQFVRLASLHSAAR
eukprot:13162827-Alexandrium_andersonii.AAC.1